MVLDPEKRSTIGFLLTSWKGSEGAVALVSVSMLLSSVAEAVSALVFGRIVDVLISNPSSPGVILVPFTALALLGFLSVLLRDFAWRGVAKLNLQMMQDASNRAFSHVQRLSTEWHASSFSGGVVRDITRGAWAIDSFNDVILLALVPSTGIILSIIGILTFRWPLVGAVMAVGAVTYIVLTSLLILRAVVPSASVAAKWDSKVGAMLADAIGSNALVRAFAGETREEDRLAGLLQKWAKRAHRTWRLQIATLTFQFTVLWALRLGVVAAATFLWWRGLASPGDVVMVLTAYFVLHGYLRDVGAHTHMFRRAVTDAEGLSKLLKTASSVTDQSGAVDLAVDKGRVVFDNVHFRYPTQPRDLYAGLSIEISPGERVGLIGPSGSGKSTFVKLLQRLHDPTSGRIEIDGQRLTDVRQVSIRRQISIVPQDIVMFHRSIADNIAYARPEATRAEIEQAARMANIHDFITGLPQGYLSDVGERGVKLSGGERQRLALARAFLADSRILVLDEATSNLDPLSERLIQDAMARLLIGRTAIVIAHRLSTVRELDRLLVFSDGAIVEQGAPDELLKDENSRFRRLHDLYFGDKVAG